MTLLASRNIAFFGSLLALLKSWHRHTLPCLVEWRRKLPLQRVGLPMSGNGTWGYDTEHLGILLGCGVKNESKGDENRESTSVTISDESIECARLTITLERELIRPFVAKRDRHLFSTQSMYI